MKKIKKFARIDMKNKRIVPGFSLKNLGTILLLPYIITFILGNSNAHKDLDAMADIKGQLQEGQYQIINETDFGTETIPLELYVADLLSRSMDNQYQQEAQKAQAILIRSNLMAKRDHVGRIHVQDDDYGTKTIPENCWNAVRQSTGVCLSDGEKIITSPYFAISNGSTRNGIEVLGKEFDYLTSVPCKRDFQADDYCSNFTYDNQELYLLWHKMQKYEKTKSHSEDLGDSGIQKDEEFILERDSTNYVLFVKWHGEVVGGEEFRVALGLPSSSFDIKIENEKTLISVKGAGHGLGMSQYGANELAKLGKDYIEIIETYFPNITITKIE